MTPAEARVLARQHPGLRAYITLPDTDPDAAFAVAVKDVIDVAGVPTTSGTTAVEASVPEHDAPVVAAVRAAGGGVVGKANLHEWAIGLTSDNPSFGRVVNPRYPDLIAGGSSGGSAAAVAAGLCDWALGTDTGGSIRVPAAACGIVGFKPTLGRLPVAGVVQVSESLDTIGPLARDVATVQSAMAVLLAETVPAPGAAPTVLRAPETWLGELHPDVREVWDRVARDLPEADLPDRVALTDAAWTVLAFEAFRFHAGRLTAQPAPFSPDVRAVIDAGADISEDAYHRAVAQLAESAAACDAAIGTGVLMIPATASQIPEHTDGGSREPLTRFTRPFNGTGQPTVCLPAPTGAPPVGIQLVAPRGEDWRVLDAALRLESAWNDTTRSI